jgi:hypothetical protein
MSAPPSASPSTSAPLPWAARRKAFGNAIQGETAKFVQQAGGQVVGNSKYPIGATDYR